VDKKSNEITALPPVLKELAHRGVVFAFDALNTQKKLVSRLSPQAMTI
jgi:predicted transposase YbfD/YdcC